ncbi:hypothetical protein [Staphylococcus phage PT1-4]
MKKLANSFQNGNGWTKLLWVVGIAVALILTWIVIQSVMFFLQTTIGFIGLLLLSIPVSMGIIAFSIMKHPRKKEYNEYSSYAQKYL